MSAYGTSSAWGNLDHMLFEGEPWAKGKNLLHVDGGWYNNSRLGRVPEHFTMSCRDRFMWHAHREALGALFEKHEWHIDESRCGNWEPDDDGENYFREAYKFFCFQGSQQRPWKPIVLCLSHDPRSFSCVFAHTRKMGGEVHDASYRWTEAGFVFRTSHKEALGAVQQAYPDCERVLVRDEHKAPDLPQFWTLAVSFPDMKVCP